MRRAQLTGCAAAMAAGLAMTPVSLAQTAPASEPAESTQEDSGPALLVADQVFITPERQLVAEGNVEVFQDGVRMTARRITYDRDTGILTIDGPIRIEDGTGSLILADAAELDDGLRNGLLSGARLVLDQQLQLAATQMTRVGGRYTQLYRTAVTSCHVCEDGRPPLWQIRAQRVIHDQEEQQLYFEGAQFRVLDVPVFYLPAMRLPDPTLERATGFLIPSIRSTTQLGTGIKVPYFFRMGDHADLTLTPYISPDTRTLEYRYRQAFRTGRIEFEGAYTEDDIQPDDTRGYLFAAGRFDLANDFKLRFNIQTASDNAYLLDYGITDIDRLRSDIILSQTRRDSFFQAGLIHFKSLRDSEDDSLIPSLVGDVFYERRFFPNAIGGEVRLGGQLHSHNRTSDVDVLGRDVNRATVEATWLRSWITPIGVRSDVELGFAADFFNIDQDSNYPDDVDRTTPAAAVAFRYPMRKVASSGATHFLEPVVQLAWSDEQGDDVPNDESTFVEFDQGNLLSLSRFPAADRREDGLRMAYGLNWARYGGQWQASATLGQVFRETADPDFTESSGLAGTSSDFLVAAQLKMDLGLSLTARTLFDDAFSFSKAEFRGDWISDRARVTSTYLWLDADAAEGRTDRVSEIWIDGSYDVNASWTASANWRYDIEDTRATTAGVGLVYRNECVEVDLSLNRRFTSSSSVEPSTDFGFTIGLRGFSIAGGNDRPKSSCS